MTMQTTTKADLANAIYEKTGGFSRRESADLVDATFQILKDELSRGGKVKLSGFGNFVVRYKRSRAGRNPVTGSEITIDSRHVVTFKPSPVLKEFINERLIVE